jgi:hypothetical protein
MGRIEKVNCLNLGDQAGDCSLLLLTGREVLVPLHQCLQCKYTIFYSACNVS